MKRKLFSICIVIFFVLMLVFPREVFTGASEGLLLWFQIILPTLLPFLIATNLLLYTDSIHYIANACGKLVRRFLCVSENGSFAVVTGFLCGYPMGAKVTADMYVSGHISKSEGQYLLSFCNNTSPMFILNYIIWQTLNKQELLLPSMIILFASPILCSFLFRHFHKPVLSHFEMKSPHTKNWDLRVFDTCIMDSFETVTKVGGYIMLFSIALTLLKSLPFQNGLLNLLTLPTLEITNGISLLHGFKLPFSAEYVAILALTSFGGWCSVAQTQCMIQKTALSIFPYIAEKLITASVTSLLALLYLNFV